MESGDAGSAIGTQDHAENMMQQPVQRYVMDAHDVSAAHSMSSPSAIVMPLIHGGPNLLVSR